MSEDTIGKRATIIRWMRELTGEWGTAVVKNLNNNEYLTRSGDTITTRSLKHDGVHSSLSTSYISGTGIEGADGIASTLASLTVPSNTLSELGDRLIIVAMWRGDTGGAITGSILLGPEGSEVAVGSTLDIGGATFFLNESLIQYIDNTHANIIAIVDGTPTAVTTMNSAGFVWDQPQVLLFTQDAALNNHIFLYSLTCDVLPKGVLG